MCLLLWSSLFDYPHLGGSQAKTVSTALYVEVINRAYDMNQADDSLKFLFSDGLVFDDQKPGRLFLDTSKRIERIFNLKLKTVNLSQIFSLEPFFSHSY